MSGIAVVSILLDTAHIFRWMLDILLRLGCQSSSLLYGSLNLIFKQWGRLGKVIVV